MSDAAHHLVPPGRIRCYLTNQLRRDTPEENVRQRWLRSLAEEYGYATSDLGVEVTIAMGKARKRADIVVYRQDAPHSQDNIEIVVETKREDALVSDAAHGVDQLHSYMAACATCQHGLWVGGERAAYEKTADGITRVHDIPRRGGGDNAPPTRRDLLGSHELKSVFRRCHNYIYANAGLQKAEAFHELLKLIFCKNYDEEESTELRFVVGPRERGNTSGQRRLLEDRLGPLFADVVARYPFIFDQDQDALQLEPDVAAYVVSELQFTSLLNTETDVKGEAYEELVGSNLRGDRGEFFTPRNVCDLAVKMAMALHAPDRLTSLRVLDCCCGTGGFLVSWLNNLHDVLLSQERSRGGIGTPEQRARQRVRDVCTRNLFGLDINPGLVKTCQMNLVLHGDGATNVHRANSTHSPGEWNDEARAAVPYGQIDVVLTNPPFGGLAKVMDRHVLANYELPAWDRDKALTAMPSERLFVEAAMRFLKPGGYLLIVLPDGILNNQNAKEVRSWLLKRARLVAVVDLPGTTFAASKGLNNPSLVVAQRYSEAELEWTGKTGRPEPYDVFMSTPQTAGVNRRAKPIYLRHPDGRERLDDHGNRIKDDEIATVAGAFRDWVESGM